MNILIIESENKIEKELVTDLQNVGKIDFVHSSSNSFPTLTAKQYKETEILGINPDNFGWALPNSVLDKFPNLKAIATITTSFEMLDLKYCNKRNLKLLNVENYATKAVAEYAIWMMLSLSRKLPLMLQKSVNPAPQSEFIQTEISGKTAGIIGFGDIGKEIAKLCTGLGMDIIYCSPNSNSKKYKKVSLNKLVKDADYIFPCYEVNPETTKIFTKDLLKRVNKEASIISILGGESSLPTPALKKMVKLKHLKGLSYEAKSFDKSGLNMFTPARVAWFSQEALDRCNQIWIGNIVKVTKEYKCKNA